MKRSIERPQGSDGAATTRRRWLQALGVAGAAGLAGCTGGDEGGDAQSTATQTEENAFGTAEPTGTERDSLPEVSGTYRTVTSGRVNTLNPLYNREGTAGTIISYALDAGYAYRRGNESFSQLYELSTDDGGKTWTAVLRENLRFSEPYGQVTAEDFVYQVRAVHQSDWAATAQASSWPSEVSVEQTGEFEFQITLPEANLLYPETQDPLLYPIPKGLLEPYVESKDAQGLQRDQELLNLSFAGNLGAYTLKEWNRGSERSFVRNEEYYLREADDVPQLFGNAPYFERLESSVVKEQAARLGALETGETDSAGVPPSQVARTEELDGVDVKVVPQPYNDVLTYNMRDNGWSAGPGNLFRETKFRQGLACAVDKGSIVQGVQRGYANVEYTWQPRWSRWYPEDADIPKYGTGDLYGREATRSRIREAIADTDYEYGDEYLLNPSGAQCEIDLYYGAGDELERSKAGFIAREIEENAGIVVHPEAIDTTTFNTNYWQQELPENPEEYEWSNGSFNAGPREVTSANSWDMEIVWGLNTYPLNPTTASIFFVEDDAYNPYGYYPDWDAEGLFAEARGAESEEALQETLTKIFEHIAQDQPMGMLSFPADTIGYASDISGPSEDYFNGWDFAAWTREE
ncbi:ABC transporter substrate-binding protein [Halolamina salifodinae]|uniref:Peptide/nickel transport system substrate-binding protein n=1 Tax=Halolamina salifodinae TaxID=1202767 RepID=A0A8T4GW22_9EURY|nr:ABC transporter substrate-binding protein [Halolamina salifodinae]MBP1987099.1 peptide/nickel transport system substrate-binding protein [Halolamina salifodinae]